MPLLDWSTNIIGYPAHRRSGAPVVGVSHMSTFTALRVAAAIGFAGGWLHAEGELPQLEGIEAREPQWVTVDALLVEQRVANTEGVVSGTLTLGAAEEAVPRPPADRSLVAWTESGGRAWLQVVDNEHAYFGGLDQPAVDRLLCWYLSQRPLQEDWRSARLEPSAADLLRRGLFEHGWSRNGDLVMTGWRPTVDLWAGIHAQSPLDHDEIERLSSLQSGLRLFAKAGLWNAKVLVDEDCPLDDETGRATPRI